MSSITHNAEQRRIFIQEGIGTYLDVCRAIHLFQTEIAKDAKDILESQRERIKVVMQLEKEMSETNRSIFPDFPEDDWSFDRCDISASVWLDKPQSASLWLGLRFSREKEGKPVCEIFCAGEVHQQHRRNKWQAIFKRSANYLNEEWNGYAVGLYRPYSLKEDLKQELALLLDDFLDCFEKA